MTIPDQNPESSSPSEEEKKVSDDGNLRPIYKPVTSKAEDNHDTKEIVTQSEVKPKTSKVRCKFCKVKIYLSEKASHMCPEIVKARLAKEQKARQK